MVTTTERGLGWRHQQERAALLAKLIPGQPCPLCGYPMYHPEQRLDLDHHIPRALGGEGPRRLVHARCNRRAGALLGAALRRARRASSSVGGFSGEGCQFVRSSRRW